MKGTKRKRAVTPAPTPAQAAVVASETLSAEPIAAATAVAEAVAVASAGVQLQANCSVRDAIGLRASLLKVLDAETSVVVDVGQVERIDTAALQVLIAFAHERRAKGRTVTWINVGTVLNEAAQTLGLTGLLGLADQAGTA